MIRMSRVTVIPDIMQIRYRAPAAAAIIPWYLAGGATGCVAAYQAKGAASLAASYVNLSSPGTYNAAPGVAPTWAAATGWTFNGSTMYLTTGVVPVIAIGTLIVQYTAFAGGLNKTLAGAYHSLASGHLLQARSGVMRTFNGTTGGYVDNATELLTGNYAVAGKAVYRNGTPEANNVPAGGSAITETLFIGALNVDGSAGQWAAVTIQALAIYSTTLSPTQVALISAAMAAL